MKKQLSTNFTLKLILLITLCFSASSHAYSSTAELPPNFSAHYKVKKGFLTIGHAERTLTNNRDGSYTYTSNSQTSGFIAALFKEHIQQSTIFKFEERIIKPLSYHYDRNGGKKVVHQIYNWQTKTVNSKRNNKLFTYQVPNIVQDQSIYQLSLMLDLKNGKRNFTYHIAENVRLVDYSVKQITSKRLKTEIGKLDTIVMQVKNAKIKTTIWCASALNYLPVKIEHEEGGVTFTAHITSVTGL